MPVLLPLVLVLTAAQGNPAAKPFQHPGAHQKARHAAILKVMAKGGHDLVFVGDSITEGWELQGSAAWKANFLPLKAADLGVGSERTDHVLWRITSGGELKGNAPKVAVVMLGTNNIGVHTPEQIAGGVAAVADALHKHNASTVVLLNGVFPRQKEPKHKDRATIRDINARLAKLADGKGTRFLDPGLELLQADGHFKAGLVGGDFVHLTAKGYDVWAAAIAPTVRSLLGAGPVAEAYAPEPVPAVGGPRRLQWKHALGLFRDDYGGKWTEVQKTGSFQFVEKSRSPELVELYDKARDYTVRLTAKELLIKGGKGNLPKYADFTKLSTGAWTAEFPTSALGKLSEKYESGGRGPATVSSGVGDPGGVSYGTYQLASKIGRADQFVAKYYPKEFAGLKGGTPEFTKKWKEIAKAKPEELHEKEHDFIKVTHYDVQAAKVAKDTGLDVRGRSRVVQDVAWSVAVQHGPSTSLIATALKPLVKAKKAEEIGDEELVRAIYAERSRLNKDGKLVYASKLDDKWTASLKSRFASEKRDALGALEAK